jgi:hypothetical protein
MDLKEIGLEGVYWIHLPQYKNQWEAAVNTVKEMSYFMKGREVVG